MTTTPTASPELPDLDHLETLARAATPGEWKAMPHGRIVGGPLREYVNGSTQQQLAMLNVTIHDQDDEDVPDRQQANTEFIAAANPEQVLALIAIARRAQPEGEAPLVEGDAIARSKRILHLVDEYVEQQTAGRRTALRCALMDQFSRDITPHQLLEVARATGLRQFLHGVNATDARQLLADFVAAVPAAACGVQQAAAPGALPGRIISATPGMSIIEVKIDHGFLPEWLDPGYQVDVSSNASSAPGTPEAPKPVAWMVGDELYRSYDEIPGSHLPPRCHPIPLIAGTPEAPASLAQLSAWRQLRGHIITDAINGDDIKLPAQWAGDLLALFDVALPRASDPDNDGEDESAAQLDGGQEGSDHASN
jgi:hypothetical protein